MSPRAELSSEYRNRIIRGDAVEVMQRLPDGYIDLVVTSPPYNLRNTSGGGLHYGGIWKNAGLIDGYDGYADQLPQAEYVAWQRECLSEMLRLIPETGAIFYNHKWRVQKGLLQDRADILSGFPVRQILIWWRRGGINFSRSFFLPTYEVIYLIAKPRFRLLPGMSKLGDVWSIPPEQKNPHPAPFPLELAERIIRATDAQIVLDPFMGSGTTVVAAVNEGRMYVGIEQSAKYIAQAEARLAGQQRSAA